MDKCRRKLHEFTPENTYILPNGSRTCRACRNVTRAKRRKEHPEQLSEERRRYRQRHPEKKELTKAWHKANPEQYQASKTQWGRDNPAKKSASNKKWAKKNPDKLRAKDSKRRALKRSQLGLWWGLIPQLIPAMLQMQNDSCAYCRRPFGEEGYHLEHMTPIARGGSHGFDNVVLAHPQCNQQKGKKTREEYLGIR